MKSRLKILFCAVVTVAAALCLMATLVSIGVLDAGAQGEAEYLLREQDGFVVVVHCGQEPQSVTMTEIRVSTLPVTDRRALADGILAQNQQELLARLEDLGS